MLDFLIHYKAYLNILPGHVFIASFIVFIILNTFENVIHYSIGRTTDEKSLTIKKPTKNDWIRIILIMIIFAVLQAVFTCIFTGC